MSLCRSNEQDRQWGATVDRHSPQNAIPLKQSHGRATVSLILERRHHGQILFVATVHPQAGKEGAVKAEMLKNMPDVRQEKGCLRYDLHVLKAGGGRCMFYEIWADQASFEAHGVAPHMMAYRERINDLLEKPTEVSVWSAEEVVSSD